MLKMAKAAIFSDQTLFKVMCYQNRRPNVPQKNHKTLTVNIHSFPIEAFEEESDHNTKTDQEIEQKQNMKFKRMPADEG